MSYSRTSEIINLSKSGLTLREIGNKFNLSHERIRQILKKNNLNISIGSEERKFTIHKYRCAWCGKIFYKKENVQNYEFCSKKCHREAISSLTKDQLAPRRDVLSRNKLIKKYKLIYVGMKNGKSICKYEHRLIMEKHLGRKLKTDEHIHHIDGNGLNNEISNLQVIKAGKHTKQTLNNWNKTLTKTYLGKIEVARKDLYKYI